MNTYLLIILILLVADAVLEFVVESLNLRHLQRELPAEFEGWYDDEKYRTSQDYLKINTRFGLLQTGILLPVMIGFILLGGFGWVDGLARSPGWGMIPTGLLFAGILMLLSRIIHLPFEIYDTFVIEERFGFNRTTVKTFVLDQLKGLALGAVIGGLVLAGILWFFATAGSYAWLYAWGALTVFQIVMLYIAPVVFLPMFNKFTPLEDGELRQAIEAYADQQRFKLSGIFKIDGSRRSTKSNAYFTGFGRWKRIALFDTLIEKHSIPELVSVLAHEVGHYRLGHIRKMMAVSILTTGLTFYILSLFITRPGLYEAFGVAYTPVEGVPPLYAGLVFFGFLYAPIQTLLGIAGNVMSRKHEFEADAYAVDTAHAPDSMVDALKKLSVDNLSNLTPHPLKVFLEYSHPPVLERIRAIRGGTKTAV